MAQRGGIIQIILRSDLVESHGYTHGIMAAQAAHAATAIIQKTHQDTQTKAYVADDNLLSMRKVVLKTESLDSLLSLQSQLTPHVKTHLWIEHPENIPTALATAPNTSNKVRNVLKAHNCTFY